MRIRLIFLLYFSIAFQEVNALQLPERMVGITFSPEYSFRFLTSDEQFNEMREFRDEIEIPKFGYTVGFNFSIKLMKKTFAEIGGSYSNKGVNTKSQAILYDSLESGTPVTLRKKYSYSFLEIPMRINYQLFENHGFFISLGLAVDFKSRERVKTYYTYGNGDKERDSFGASGYGPRVSLNGIGGLGYFFQLSKDYFLKVEPFFKCAITPTVNDALKEYFYSYGLDVGIYLAR